MATKKNCEGRPVYEASWGVHCSLKVRVNGPILKRTCKAGRRNLASIKPHKLPHTTVNIKSGTLVIEN